MNSIESPVDLLEGDKKKIFMEQKQLLEKQREQFKQQMQSSDQ